MKIIIEKDNFNSFTNVQTIIKNNKVDKLISEMGYKIVRVPYFLQPSSYLAKIYFNLNIDYIQKFHNGFLYTTNEFPAYYCELGMEKFHRILDLFIHIKDEIIKTLIIKIAEKKSIEGIVPLSMLKLLSNYNIDIVWNE